MSAQSPPTRQDEPTVRALVYSSQLFMMGSHARHAVASTRAMGRIMPTDLATAAPVCPQVAEWAEGLNVVPYEQGMGRDYHILWSLDPLTYAEPLAKRNLAWVTAPHFNNVPPPQYELFGVSDYVVAAIEKTWDRLATRLYPGVHAWPQFNDKEKIILYVGSFIAPNALVDHGHRQAIDQFRLLCEAGIEDWQLVLLGALAPGQGAYLDQLQEAVTGLNVKLIVNADQPTLNAYLGMAAVYWHLEGLSLPSSPPAQGHFPHALVEAAASGTVPLAVKQGAAAEFVIHGYNGFLVETAEQCIEMTRTLIMAPSAWSMLSQRARTTSRGWIREDIFTDNLRAVLENRRIVKPPVPRWLDHAPAQDQVCAVIPAYNLAETTGQCLETLHKLNPQVKIILVDNGSQDDMTALQAVVEARGGTYLRRDTNGGLGAALAEAKPHCDRPYVLLMHNDTLPVLSGDWLDVLLAEMQDASVGIVGAKLKKPDGKTVQFAGWGFTSENGGMFFHLGDGERDEPRLNQRLAALGVSSACMLCRRDLFDPDPGYHIVYSDLDLCLKARKQEQQVVYQPASVLVHQEGATRSMLPEQQELLAADKDRFFTAYRDLIGGVPVKA